LELHNVQQYLEHGFLPVDYDEAQRTAATARIPRLRGAVARFFAGVDDSNVAAVIGDVEGVGFDYQDDLLELLGRNGAYERCAASTVLPALSAVGVHLGVVLRCRKLVEAYDVEIRDKLVSSVQGAEFVIAKYLQDGAGEAVYLPRSFTAADSRAALERYIDAEHVNLNYVGLIASAKETPAAGIDARLKLRAKRRHDALNAEFFESNDGFTTGCEVSITDQDEPVREEVDESDGLVGRYTYSRRWLEETRDNASILNNFIHLFEFIDREGLLTFPSYPANMGVMERFMGTPGKTEYRVGAAFRTTDMSSLLQTRLYHHFLETEGIDLEQVIKWFFQEHLVDEFGARHFSFAPSDASTSYLQRVRHLLPEMESVASQFSLFVADGELDRDLLAMGSDQVRYKAIPSLLDGKYLYATDSDEITNIVNLLFSDQAPLTYISEELKAENGALLLLKNEVAYDDFHSYQRPAVDYLIRLGVLRNDTTRVVINDMRQLMILSALFKTQCAHYYRLSHHGRAIADEMVDKGWAERRSTLLSEPEGKYFNYFLNAVDFSNGPQLRNKYLHGSQANTEGEDAHFHTYMTVLRLIVALVLKLNDEFCLADEAKHSPQ
jgi:hypothetical protein